MIFIASPAQAQPATKKIRMDISTTSIVFLPFYAAMHKGFYKDEGIDLELIVMPATLASTAVVTGDVDYNGAVTRVIGAAVQGRSLKVLIFTADRTYSPAAVVAVGYQNRRLCWSRSSPSSSMR